MDILAIYGHLPVFWPLSTFYLAPFPSYDQLLVKFSLTTGSASL